MSLTGRVRSLEWIAQHFNQQHLRSAWGKMWTPVMVKDYYVAPGQSYVAEKIHRNAIREPSHAVSTFEKSPMTLTKKSSADGEVATLGRRGVTGSGGTILSDCNVAGIERRNSTGPVGIGGLKEISMITNTATKQQQPPSFTPGIIGRAGAGILDPGTAPSMPRSGGKARLQSWQRLD